MNPLPDFAEVPIHDNGEPLVNLADYTLLYEPKYFEMKFTTDGRMFLREGVARKLLAIQKRLEGFRIKVWDGWRSRTVQKKLYDQFSGLLAKAHPEWDEVELEKHATRYVNLGSDPRIIPPHATGGTVDVTLTDEGGVELDMGTEFDHFGERAAPMYFEENDIDRSVRENRARFRDAMLSEDFYLHPHEWWHVEYGTQSWALATGQVHALYDETAPTGSLIR